MIYMVKFCPNCAFNLSNVVQRVSEDTAPTQKQSKFQEDDNIENEVESRIIKKVILKKKPTEKQLAHYEKMRNACKVKKQAKKLIQETNDEPKQIKKKVQQPESDEEISEEIVVKPNPQRDEFVPLF